MPEFFLEELVFKRGSIKRVMRGIDVSSVMALHLGHGDDDEGDGNKQEIQVVHDVERMFACTHPNGSNCKVSMLRGISFCTLTSLQLF